jgi:27-O-demethylrifamycin SV methyltransferase
MTASSADPAHHYDRVSAAWNIILGDDHHHGLFDGADTSLATATENLTRTMARAAEPQPGARIVDLGCGTGAQACWLAEHYPATSVVGITTSAVGMSLARQRSEAAGLADAVSFKCADALDSGLADGAFDVVWLLESSQYLGPRPRLMHECARLLVPGGRVALCDVVLTRPLGLRDLRRWHDELDILRDSFGEAVLATPEQYREAAVEAGFEITQDVDLTERVVPTFGCWRERARHAQADVIPLIGEAGLSNFIAGCDVMERFFTEGIIGYALIAGRHKAAS